MEKSRNINIKSILRWIAFLPAAVIAGFLVYNIIWYIQSFMTWMFVGSGTVVEIYFVRFFSYLCQGLSTVYVACYVAPSYKKIVAVVTGVMVLVFAGASLFYAITVPEYLWIVDSIALTMGALGSASTIYNKEQAAL